MSFTTGIETPVRALARGSVAVCIPILSAPDLLFQCLRAVVEHTPAEVPIVLVQGPDTDPAVERQLAALDRAVLLVRSEVRGAVELATAAITACGDADVALLASHSLVPQGWYERLRGAAASDSTVATASALGNNAGLLSIQGPYDPLPPDASLERVAADIADRSPRLLPRVPTADGHCVWIKRGALELAGPLETEFGSLRAALIDFSQRCQRHNLLNVCADDLFVASIMPEVSARGGTLDVGKDRDLLERRYPYLRKSLDRAVWQPLSLSLAAARRAIGNLSVTIDARILRGTFSGAQAETLELIETLDRLREVEPLQLQTPTRLPRPPSPRHQTEQPHQELQLARSMPRVLTQRTLRPDSART